jgi:hypothetical protein
MFSVQDQSVQGRAARPVAAWRHGNTLARGLFHNVLFALAFGFAAAIVLGLVN